MARPSARAASRRRPALLVGVRCPLDAVLARHRASDGDHLRGSDDDPFPAPVRAWQDLIHDPGIYDVEVDTSVASPEACAAVIARTLRDGAARPTAFARLAST